MVLVSSFVQKKETPDASCGVEEEAPFAGTASAKRDEGIRSACSIFLSSRTIHSVGAAARCAEPERGIRVRCGTEFMYQCLTEIRIRREPLASRNASASASSLQQCTGVFREGQVVRGFNDEISLDGHDGLLFVAGICLYRKTQTELTS